MICGGTHETLLLERGVPVHVVAARCGHDPAVLLRNYAKRTRKADTSAASVIGSITIGPRLGPDTPFVHYLFQQENALKH